MTLASLTNVDAKVNVGSQCLPLTTILLKAASWLRLSKRGIGLREINLSRASVREDWLRMVLGRLNGGFNSWNSGAMTEIMAA